ncbi:MAG: flippase [Candidatus Omnitrophota bacterium]
MKPIVRNSVFMSLFNIFGRATGIIRYLLLAAFLSTPDYGLINFALNIGKLGRHFMDGGLDNLISRDGARDHEKVPTYCLHGLAVKSALGLLFFVGIFFYLKGTRGKSWSELAVIYACLSGSAMVAFAGVIRSCFTAIERMEYVFYTNLPSRLISLLSLFIILWYSWPLVLTSFSISLEFFIWFLLLAIVSFRFFSYSSIKLTLPTFRYMFLESWPLALYDFFNTFYMTLDVMMIEYMMGGSDPVAPYAYASQLVEGFTLLLTGYLIAIYPVLSRYHETDDDAYRRLFEKSVILLLAYTLPLTFLLGIWSSEWMSLIPKAEPLTGDVLRILIINLNLSMLNTLVIIVFTSRNRQRWLALFTGLAVVISFLTNWVFIRWYEQVGAAFASLLSQLALFLIMSAAGRRLFALSFPLRKPLEILGISALAGFSAWIIPFKTIFLIPFFYGAFLLLYAYLFGVFTLAELRRWRSALKT